MINDIAHPGKLIEIQSIQSNYPSGDDNITSYSPMMKNIYKKMMSRPNVPTNHTIHGRSWEMAGIMSLAGYSGIYSGVVEAVHYGNNNITIYFGPVKHIYEKRKLYKNLQTSNEIIKITLFPSNV
uniref:Uncharacterized protein n=1 Tax=viral metagenome TaxID=1070528 RepID=A0A2V0RJQ5_9ZZZZ